MRGTIWNSAEDSDKTTGSMSDLAPGTIGTSNALLPIGRYAANALPHPLGTSAIAVALMLAVGLWL